MQLQRSADNYINDSSNKTEMCRRQYANVTIGIKSSVQLNRLHYTVRHYAL